MKKTQTDYFNDSNYWLFGAAFKTLDKKFHFDLISLGEFNRLFEKFLKLL